MTLSSAAHLNGAESLCRHLQWVGADKVGVQAEVLTVQPGGPNQRHEVKPLATKEQKAYALNNSVVNWPVKGRTNLWLLPSSSALDVEKWKRAESNNKHLARKTYHNKHGRYISLKEKVKRTSQVRSRRPVADYTCRAVYTWLSKFTITQGKRTTSCRVNKKKAQIPPLGTAVSPAVSRHCYY